MPHALISEGTPAAPNSQDSHQGKACQTLHLSQVPTGPPASCKSPCCSLRVSTQYSKVCDSEGLGNALRPQLQRPSSVFKSIYLDSHSAPLGQHEGPQEPVCTPRPEEPGTGLPRGVLMSAYLSAGPSRTGPGLSTRVPSAPLSPLYRCLCKDQDREIR